MTLIGTIAKANILTLDDYYAKPCYGLIVKDLGDRVTVDFHSFCCDIEKKDLIEYVRIPGGARNRLSKLESMYKIKLL